jgi:hypothetical protein
LLFFFGEETVGLTDDKDSKLEAEEEIRDQRSASVDHPGTVDVNPDD